MVTKPGSVPIGPRSKRFVDPAVTRALERLRRQGHRVTNARRVVLETLARRGGHPTADELCAEIEQRHSGVHRATVYRTLEMLAELGEVTHVHMGHGATAYHLTTSADGQEHLHARCRVCGRVIDLPADLLEPIGRRLTRENDFILDPRHVALSGACKTCHELDG
jgi:Fur family ferric uptake transcriptional regulator